MFGENYVNDIGAYVMIWNVEPRNLLKLDFSFPIGSVATNAEDLIKYRYLQARPFFACCPVRSELVKAVNIQSAGRSIKSMGLKQRWVCQFICSSR